MSKPVRDKVRLDQIVAKSGRADAVLARLVERTRAYELPFCTGFAASFLSVTLTLVNTPASISSCEMSVTFAE